MSEREAFAGIDIGGTNIKFGLVAADGEVIHKEMRPTLAAKGAEPLMHLIENIAERLLFVAAEEEYSVRTLGIGSPGAVDFATGRVIGPCPHIVGWTGTEIGSRLTERLNLPVLVDNDGNAMALAELKFGAARGVKSAVCVTVGTGIGGGVILNGRLWRGATSSAAEIGHVTINYDGPECKCGNNGCLEVYCSSAAMIAQAKAALSNGLTPVFESLLDGKPEKLSIKKLFSAAKKKDSIAIGVIEQAGSLLGTGLAGIVNLLNPETVVVGGGITDGGAGFVDAVSAEIRKRAFHSAVGRLKVVRATLGNNAGFTGAAFLGEHGQ